MAQIVNPKYGNLSGRIGDLVFVTKYGKTFVYYRPKEEKKKTARKKKDSLRGIISKMKENKESGFNII